MNFRTIEVSGNDAVETLMRLRREFASSSEYPFIIGDADELARLGDGEEVENRTVEQIVSDSLEIDVVKWFEEQRDRNANDGIEGFVGEWPTIPPDKWAITAHRNMLAGKLKPKVFLGLAKVSAPWHLPAVTKYGDWNDCPPAHEHCAIHRYWNAEYGAEILSVSPDVIECIVERPPRTRDTALALAWQQCFYCFDVVLQCAGTVERLAATLLDSEYWYFWWD